MDEDKGEEKGVIRATPNSKEGDPGKGTQKDLTIQDLVGFLYNSNPFYLISAGILLYAQSILFQTSNINLPTLIPVGLIAAYSLLLAGTAVFLVKWGRVWDDARSILLILLLLVMILSVGTDSETLDSLQSGLLWSGGAYLFSILLLEGIRRVLKIHISGRFLIPAYGFLTLFFFYPILCARLIVQYPGSKTPAMIGILLFPVAAGLLLLSFLPFLHQKTEQENGTPWKAPWFPWSIAMLLATGAIFRTYLLTISFHPGRGVGGFQSLESGFQLWMLTPILLAGLILLEEYRIKQRKTLWPALLFPLALLPGLIASDCMNPAEKEFNMLIADFQPWSIVFAGILMFYIYARLRKIPYSELGIAVVLLIFACNQHPVKDYWTGGAAFLILLWFAVRKNSTMIWTINLLLGILFLNRIVPSLPPEFSIYPGLALVVIFNTFRSGKTAKIICGIFQVLLLICILLAMFNEVPERFFYCASATSILMIGAGLFRFNLFTKIICGIMLGAWIIFLGIRGYEKFFHIRELKILFWAGLFFLLALGVSLHKGFRKKRLKKEEE